MQARYLLFFRAILLEILLLQALYAPEGRLEGWLWLAFPSYAAYAWFWYHRSRSGHGIWEMWSFFGDIAATSGVLFLTRGFSSDFYIAYFMVILASCFLEELWYSFIVGLVACVVYGALALPAEGVFEQPFYLLRTSLLLATAFFATYVAGIARRAQAEAGERYGEELAWMHRLSFVGRALAGVLHEVKTPVSTIILSADYIRDKIKEGHAEEADAQLQVIEQEARRAIGILGDFLEYTKPSDLALAALDLRLPLRKVLDAMAMRLDDRSVIATLDCPDGLVVLGSERHLIQVFSNLVMNSIDAMPLGGTLALSARAQGGAVEASVRDSGEGIAPEVLSKLFEPFSSTRLGESGHGLGLFVARWIVLKHGGELRAESGGKGMGSVMTVRLPRAPKVNL